MQAARLSGMSLKEKLRNLAQDKIVLFLLFAILASGILVRVYDYNEVGMWNDDTSTIPTGLLWFYNHNYYPGLSGQGEPALGNLLVGAGCMLSGEDFSNVEKIIPMYYAGREVLLGNPITKAIGYCRMPSVLFGIMLLFIVALMSLAVFDKYTMLFTTAFYAFYPPLIQLSTFIHVDVFSYVFIAASLTALYMFYAAQTGTTKEKLYFATAILFAALAFGTKLPNVAYLIFAFLLLAEKNFDAIKLWLGKTLDLSFVNKEEKINAKPLLENLAIGAAVAAAAIYVVFEFSFKNVIEVISKYRSVSTVELATFGLNSRFFKFIYNFFFHANPLDVALFLLSVYIIIKLTINFKELNKNEKFLLYLYAMFLVINTFMTTFEIIRVMLMFTFTIIMAMGMSLSSRHSPIPHDKKRIAALTFMLAYLVVAGGIAFSISPHFMSCNTMFKSFTPDKCIKNYGYTATKQIGEKLNSVMAGNETFVNLEGILFYYVRPEQGIQHLQLREQFRQRFGRMPTVKEKVKYFEYPNKTIRYVVALSTGPEDDPTVKNLMQTYEPNEIAYLKRWPAAYIYDLKSLKAKSR